MADFESFIPALHKPASLLPIARHRDALLYTVEKHQITVLIGQTGSGKTTQLPQFLEQAGWCNDGKVIAITQACMTYHPDRAMIVDGFLQDECSHAEWPLQPWQNEWQRR